MTTITIPDSVTAIGDDAFRGCCGLATITIPGSVTTIGRDAFSGCTSLTSITIPDSVTSIGGSAFHGCESLTSVTIPDSVTSIGSSLFYDCRSLKSVYVNITDLAAYSTNNVMNKIEVDKHLLVNGVEITELLVPDSVTTIGRGAFSGCTSLTSITIPDSVTSIGGSAFRECTSLKEVYCKAKTPPTGGGWYMFDNNASGRKIYVPRNSVAAYKSSRYWSSYANDIVGYDF